VPQTTTSPPPYCPAGMTPSKVDVLDRVVLHPERRAPRRRIQCRTLRHRPAHQHAVDLQPKVRFAR
jgi:hypothetical protein